VGGTAGTANKLRSDGARLTQTALRLPPGMRFGEWATAGGHFCALASASAWWLGDWWVYGERTYGKRYERAVKAAPLSYQTLRNYAWVARRFPPPCRRPQLSFQHHAEVAALAEADRELWLERAERMQWSRNELRRHLSAARRARRSGDGSALVVRIELDVERQDRWRQAAAAADRPLTEWLFEVADAAARSLLAISPPDPVIRPRSESTRVSSMAA
jgi:hypothetical protein